MTTQNPKYSLHDYGNDVLEVSGTFHGPKVTEQIYDIATSLVGIYNTTQKDTDIEDRHTEAYLLISKLLYKTAELANDLGVPLDVVARRSLKGKDKK